MPYVIFFPSTGACRVFDSYNLAEATYPNNPIIPDPLGVSVALDKWNKPRKASDRQTIHEWYEILFEWVDAAGYLSFVDGVVVKSPKGSTHKRPKFHDDDDPSTMAKAFWNLAINAGNLINKQPVASSEKKRGRPTGFSVDLVRANEALMAIQAREIKVPLQVRQMIELLTKKEFDYYTAAEMQRLCGSSEFYQNVRTTQDGWRIWRYYQPMLRELGVVKA